MSEACEECGAFGNLPHEWTEGTCLLPHSYTKPRHPPQAKIGWACQSCVEKHHEWLTEITELYATLDAVLDPGSVPDTTAEHGRPKKQPASPAPMRLDAWALLHPGLLNFRLRQDDGTYEHTGMSGVPDVRLLLANWAQAVYDALSYGTASAPDTITGAAAVLTTHDDTLYRLPDIDTYDAELRWVRKALRGAHGIPDPRVLGDCLSVDCRGTVWESDRRCDHCGRRYERLDLVRLQVNERQASA